MAYPSQLYIIPHDMSFFSFALLRYLCEEEEEED